MSDTRSRRSALGLSPRVRGNLQNCIVSRGGLRSIPACAGEPRRSIEGRWLSGVYPRVCGGTPHVRPLRRHSVGLSPRVRGNLKTKRYCARATRSIPACAGEPIHPQSPVRRRRVYPRVCGGTRVRRSLDVCLLGLSPRVRGNLQLLNDTTDRSRSIPACAGEPLHPVPMVRRAEVYPRVCGGTSGTFPSGGNVEGLSPRVRGNQRPTTHHPHNLRSIPACAGEPQ